MFFFSILLSAKDRLTLTLSKSLYLLLPWWWSSFNLPFFPFCNLTTIIIWLLLWWWSKVHSRGMAEVSFLKKKVKKRIKKVSLSFFYFLYFLRFSTTFWAILRFLRILHIFGRFILFMHFLQDLRFIRNVLQKSVIFYAFMDITACHNIYDVIRRQDFPQKSVEVRCLLFC
jgi:hypothetical protein